MPPPSPVVALMEFSLLVKERRRELGLKAEVVADHLGFSRVYYSSVENSRAILADAKLGPLVELLKFDERGAAKLAELLGIARTSGWWARSLAVDDFKEFIGLEHGAARVRVYESKVVTGLLQTRPYATSIVKAAPETGRAFVDPHVDVRMKRQERLEGPDPLELEIVLSETTIMQEIGGPEVLLEQLKHLADMVASRENIGLRIQPFSMTPLGLINAATIAFFEFTSPGLPIIAWVEAIERYHIERDPEIVRRLLLQFEQVSESSLNRAESLQLVQERITALEKITGS